MGNQLQRCIVLVLMGKVDLNAPELHHQQEDLPPNVLELTILARDLATPLSHKPSTRLSGSRRSRNERRCSKLSSWQLVRPPWTCVFCLWALDVLCRARQFCLIRSWRIREQKTCILVHSHIDYILSSVFTVLSSASVQRKKSETDVLV